MRDVIDQLKCWLDRDGQITPLGEQAIAEIERLRERIRIIDDAVTAFGKALSLSEGPSLAVQKHNPSWEAWKDLCDVLAGVKR